MVKIAICGKMCSGKTTISNALIEHYCKRHIELSRVSFASGIYEIARNYFFMTNKDRGLLQHIGTKMKEIDNNVWIRHTLAQTRDKNVIIDDCRFPDELNALKCERFIIVKLVVDDDTQTHRLMMTYPNDWYDHLFKRHHISETALDQTPDDEYSIIIDSSNTNVENIVESILGLMTPGGPVTQDS